MRRLLLATLSAAILPAALAAQNSFAGSNSGMGTLGSLTPSTPSASVTAPSTTAATPPSIAAKNPKKIKPAHEPRMLDAHINSGTLTVDGMIAKARLNYDVRTTYLYFFVPGVGTVVVAQEKFGDAEKQEKAFRGNSLIVLAEGHTVELASQTPIANGKGRDAWVYVDHNFGYPDNRYPVVGFGNTRNAPYNWPGSKASPTTEMGRNNAPPVPKNLMPKMEVVSSYTVVVRPGER